MRHYNNKTPGLSDGVPYEIKVVKSPESRPFKGNLRFISFLINRHKIGLFETL